MAATDETYHWDNKSRRAVVACAMVFSALATVMVIWKVYLRKTRKRWAADDWLIIASLPFMHATSITAVLVVIYGGLGRSYEDLLSTNPEQVSNSLKLLFADEIFYVSTLSLTKLSILAMYRNLFPTTRVHVAAYAMGALVLMWWLAVLVVTFLQCRPLNGLWDHSISSVCMASTGLFLGNSIPNIVTDVLILTLPLVEVTRLQMSWPKKNGVLVLFLLGGVTIVISGLRMKAGLYIFSISEDYTLTIAPLWAWTVVEPAMGIICACLPTLGGPVIGQLIKWISTPKKKTTTRGNEGTSGKRSSFHTLVTVGGSSSKGINRPARSKARGGDSGNGSFELLTDERSSHGKRHTNLWPKGYHGERHTTVSGRRTPSERSDDIPLTSITIRQEMTWSEMKIEDFEAQTPDTPNGEELELDEYGRSNVLETDKFKSKNSLPKLKPNNGVLG